MARKKGKSKDELATDALVAKLFEATGSMRDEVEAIKAEVVKSAKAGVASLEISREISRFVVDPVVQAWATQIILTDPPTLTNLVGALSRVDDPTTVVSVEYEGQLVRVRGPVLVALNKLSQIYWSGMYVNPAPSQVSNPKTTFMAKILDAGAQPSGYQAVDMADPGSERTVMAYQRSDGSIVTTNTPPFKIVNGVRTPMTQADLTTQSGVNVERGRPIMSYDPPVVPVNAMGEQIEVGMEPGDLTEEALDWLLDAFGKIGPVTPDRFNPFNLQYPPYSPETLAAMVRSIPVLIEELRRVQQILIDAIVLHPCHKPDHEVTHEAGIICPDQLSEMGVMLLDRVGFPFQAEGLINVLPRALHTGCPSCPGEARWARWLETGKLGIRPQRAEPITMDDLDTLPF